MAMTKYIWDPESDNVLQETDELGATTATYTQEPDEFGALVSQNRNGTKSYYHFDALGSTRELTDENENVTDTNMYDAWGVNVASSGTTENPFRWVGEVGYYFDKLLSQLYVRRRQYEPTVARWTAGDPMWPLATRYSYADDMPTSAIDPTGMARLVAGTSAGLAQHVQYIGQYIGDLIEKLADPLFPVRRNASIKLRKLLRPLPCYALRAVCYTIYEQVPDDPYYLEAKHRVANACDDFFAIKIAKPAIPKILRETYLGEFCCNRFSKDIAGAIKDALPAGSATLWSCGVPVTLAPGERQQVVAVASVVDNNCVRGTLVAASLKFGEPALARVSNNAGFRGGFKYFVRVSLKAESTGKKCEGC